MSISLDEVLNAMSLQELIDAREQMDALINRTKKAEYNATKKKILELARMHGIDLAFTNTTIVSERPKMMPKYRNPENLEQTWSGQGRKPAWVEELLVTGRMLEEFRI